jgi:hypothetical protein
MNVGRQITKLWEGIAESWRRIEDEIWMCWPLIVLALLGFYLVVILGVALGAQSKSTTMDVRCNCRCLNSPPETKP